MKLSTLLQAVNIVGGNTDVEVRNIAYDSRKVEAGDVFVCIKGYATDGHTYVQKAIENGAAAIVAQDPITAEVPVVYVQDTRLALAQMSKVYYDRPDEKMKIIGVTGTNGKTTVTYLIKHILEQNGAKVGLIGTNQNMIGAQVIETERTTPESKELYAMFADM
ncbi:MAG: UDP-N-acetylmuramoyl-L-alanyl-D-glutamate--2,6-diaminopimelate ligase, partial [Clostridia bacterium]|nr:UDP-N-acetylmuramoyl-L-alanyl-D-glutamate--2,6-diaminopimelate ligase [Clostridia bacterium]